MARMACVLAVSRALWKYGIHLDNFGRRFAREVVDRAFYTHFRQLVAARQHYMWEITNSLDFERVWMMHEAHVKPRITHTRSKLILRMPDDDDKNPAYVMEYDRYTGEWAVNALSNWGKQFLPKKFAFSRKKAKANPENEPSPRA